MSIVYLSICLWIKYITRVKILGLCKDEANQKCAPWALLAQNVLVKGPSDTQLVSGYTPPAIWLSTSGTPIDTSLVKAGL